MRDRGDVGAARRQLARRADDRFRFDQRLVTLDVDDDRIAMPAALRDHLGQAVGAGRMVAARHQRRHLMRLGSGPHVAMIGRHPDLFRPRQPGAFGDAHDHRLAAKVEQRLGRQAGRCVTRRNDDLEGETRHAYSSGGSWRASSSSMIGMSSRIG